MKTKLPDACLQLTLLCIIFLVINMATVALLPIELSRLVRVSTTLLLLLFLSYHRGHKQLIVFLGILFFALRDSLIIDYETEFNKTFVFIITIFAYLLLVSVPLKKLRLSKSTPVIIIFVLTLIALNVFNVYYLSDVVRNELDTPYQLVLFFVQGAVLIVLGFVGFMYNERVEGKTPLIYLYFVLCFILSDLCGLAAYFFKFEPAYFPERAFYIIGLVLLVNFSLNQKIIQESRITERKREYLL
ncbi:hypothetical protein [Altibacter sp.]|uniref:hypothetical protein n=1 Tax=Altibacter sp. TaxID=2024823 RepID=UPI00258F6490|nr:hypothetical protein [Altibacter sp.]MCW9038158.1 hypothetical protein [Altibacter sp.]